jgi:hypothetical protein
MLWSAFATTAANIRNKEEAQFQNVTDADLILLKQTQAKRDMLFDLLQILNYDTESDITSILDEHTDFLREALSYRQLYWYWLELDNGEGSPTHLRMTNYSKLYDKCKLQFSKLESDIIDKVYSIPVRR